ncbi:MAG: exodeoxyribonuclease III [Rubrivivax sp.]|nr:exodeoxyribonuclease III [Rubrivivax sp.]
MKICSYNVNSIKARKDLVLQWIERRKNDLDVLCLQELKTEDAGFPGEDFEKLGFECYLFGQKAYNGVAILTKVKPQKMLKGFNDEAWDAQKRLIRAEFPGIRILNVYAPHGDVRGTEKFDYKQQWYKNFRRYLTANFAATDPLLIVGDFNIAHKDIDVYSPEELADSIGTMPEERAASERLLDWGLVDAFRKLYPEKRQFTWWDYIGGAVWKDQGMRIDYALATGALMKKIKSVEVDLWPRKRQKPTPSDHAPLIVDIDAG